ncbi:helix-turn-helix transcriptional regulator [Nitrospirillum iridis]|uniref:Putative DNA-binding transcriptional regulator AlpA n=1 Tax=Nitrospirillum iridis TaxID=765888 RepID=A0A7X0AY08_9PROT|nr:hypothetical protein [Nitrospirillum iridis]MBB6251396.1 putative DNA-binding transcriptional regulator AlpA [Nitrospirillum iridis]
MTKRGILPASLPPRGLSREQAAEYVGISATKFDQMIERGAMPRPKRIDGRRVWDLMALDAAFSALPDEAGAAMVPPAGDVNPWDVDCGLAPGK